MPMQGWPFVWLIVGAAAATAVLSVRCAARRKPELFVILGDRGVAADAFDTCPWRRFPLFAA